MSLIRPQYDLLAKHVHWAHRKRHNLTDQQRYWLRGNQSLTKQLIAFSDGQFRVQVLREFRGLPYAHEAAKLNIPLHIACHIREVELLCHDEATVFARSIIPLDVLKGTGLQLAHLGNKPLGHLLFKQAKVDLEQRQVAKIELNDHSSWARRTVYQFNRAGILVSEFFLMSL